VRPGGRIILADDDHDVLRLWPEPPGLNDLWRAYIRSYERIGNDPFIGRRLVSLLVQAGARPQRNDWIFFGGCAGDDHFNDLVDNLHGILLGATGAVAGFFASSLVNYNFGDGEVALVFWWLMGIVVVVSFSQTRSQKSAIS